MSLDEELQGGVSNQGEQEVPYEDKLREIERLAQAGDAIAFYQFANRMGYYDEDEIKGTPFSGHRVLYLQGKALAEQKTTAQSVQSGRASGESKPKRRGRILTRSETYADFLKEGRVYETADFDSHALRKRALLVKYFSHRFGEDGSQPINNYEDISIGVIFSKMLSEARKRAGSQQH